MSNLVKRRRIEKCFKVFCLAMTFSSMLVLALLLYHLIQQGADWISWDFMTNLQSRFPQKSGIKAGIAGTIWLMGLTAIISIPVGVAAAVFLEEYGVRGKWGSFIELNVSNLAGVPSIVYGLLGLTIFVRFLGMGGSLLAGACTLSLLIMPVIVVSTREAIRAVPDTIRFGAYAVGAIKWQVVWWHVLPMALPGILTGVILALSRAIGETAPLIIVGALAYVSFVPASPKDEFTSLPMIIYNWASRPQEEFHYLAAAGILVLLAVMLTMNFVAVLIRYRSQKRNRI